MDDPTLRSVSQMGGESTNSHVYVKMSNPCAPTGAGAASVSRDESDYISVLYSAVQRGGGGGVRGRGGLETAVSPYLRLMKSENEKCQRRLSDLMNVKQVSYTDKHTKS